MERGAGAHFASWAFTSKAAAGLGSLVAWLALQAIGFSSGSTHAAAQLPPQVVCAVGAIYRPGTGLLAFGAAAARLFYRLMPGSIARSFPN